MERRPRLPAKPALTMRVEGELQDIAIQSADHREGVAAFLQKRPAQFRGH